MKRALIVIVFLLFTAAAQAQSLWDLAVWDQATWDTSDGDGDLMADDWEKIHFGTTAYSGTADTDQDGLSNRDEYQHRTDPNMPDTDGDGIPDGWEIAYQLDPLADDADEDMDGDQFTNRQEFELDTHPDDADSIPCEDETVDSDGDGIIDQWDLCADSPMGLPTLANGCTASASYQDADGDGVPDEWDGCPDTRPGDPTDATGCTKRSAVVVPLF